MMTPDEELRLLAAQPMPDTVKSQAKLAQQIFEDNAGLAAEIVCDIMVNSPNEKTKLMAAKYVADRVLGRVGEQKVAESENPWDNLFNSVIREPSEAERKDGARVSRI